VLNPFQPIDDERARRMAERKNQKQDEKYPLFAGLLPQVTPEQLQRAAREHSEAFGRLLRDFQERGDGYREQVRALVGPEVFLEMERRREVLPSSPEYHVDYWRRQLEALRPETEKTKEAP
jgi:hypothetical protein